MMSTFNIIDDGTLMARFSLLKSLFKPCYKNLFQISSSCNLSEYEQLSGTVYRDYLCQPAVDVWITPSFGLISLSGGNPE